MRITFLGTGAATSYPLAFCRCEYCNLARKLGEKNLRRRSSVIINDDLLIDMGPDVVSASFMYHKSIADIRYCLQTHPHSDHFDASHLTTRVPEYRGVNTPPLQLCGSEATLEKMSEMLANEGYVDSLFDSKAKERMNIKVFPVKPLQPFRVGKYMVTGFQANHDLSVQSLLYSVREDDSAVFYGTDTDNLPEETWDGFRKLRMQFSIVILDHSYGPGADGSGHLNANRFVEQVRRMKDENILASNARILATHISHEGNPVHSELSKYAEGFGYEIACDGLVIDSTL